KIFIGGSPVNRGRPDKSVALRLGLLTADRKRTGLCLNLTQAENLTIANVGALIKKFRLDHSAERSVTRQFIDKLHIRPGNPAAIVARMSGGNQQKVLFGRWLFAGSNVFLLDEPTRGVDVAARSEIYKAINELVEAGAAVVLSSSDLPELIGMAD